MTTATCTIDDANAPDVVWRPAAVSFSAVLARFSPGREIIVFLGCRDTHSTNLYLLPVSETPASRVLLFTFSPPRWHLRRCGLCTHSVSQHRSFFLKRRFAPGGELHLISESLRSPFRLTRQCWRPASSRWRTRLTASSFAAQLLDGGERELEPLGRKQCVHLLGCERSIRALQLMDSDECCRPPRMPPLW